MTRYKFPCQFHEFARLSSVCEKENVESKFSRANESFVEDSPRAFHRELSIIRFIAAKEQFGVFTAAFLNCLTDSFERSSASKRFLLEQLSLKMLCKKHEVNISFHFQSRNTSNWIIVIKI